MSDTQELEAGEMLHSILRNLVDDPGAVSVDRTSDGKNVTFKVRVRPSEVGKVVGANGRTARALRVILNAVAAKLRTQFILDIVEDSGLLERRQ